MSMHAETESILSNISSFSSPININKQNFEFLLNRVYSRSFTKFEEAETRETGKQQFMQSLLAAQDFLTMGKQCKMQGN